MTSDDGKKTTPITTKVIIKTIIAIIKTIF